MKKGRIYSILFNRCPRCHKGKFFVTDNPYNLKKFSEQNSGCPVCGEDFMRETGFYYGAMYASYGLNVILGILVYLVTNILFDWGATGFLWTFIIAAIVLWPWLYRTGRLIWINLFVGPKR
jgi:ribosomal protein S27AE